MEECFPAIALSNNTNWRDAFYLHYQLNLLSFIFSCKERVACVELKKNSAKTPHIDGCCVIYPKQYFRSSVESTLYIRVNAIFLEATTPKINQFDARFSDLP
jgi:hypothetical protein